MIVKVTCYKSRVDLVPGMSLTWNCFSEMLSCQMRKRVGGLGVFQSPRFTGSLSPRQYL